MTVNTAHEKRKTRTRRHTRRMTVRMRAARRRAVSWKRRAKHAALAAMLAAGISASSTTAEAQYGGMPPNGGVLNRAATRFGQRNQNGPGWMYFGINPADRGLGYNGGYITLGGFIPYAEDNYGGFWAADLRGHLSEYGGFFSNVGAVRKQFVGGSLLGVGVYWDYDGDQSQYPTGGLPGTEIFGQFSQSYNQVGVSGEWLTDYGNFRSNGYIPVGQTAATVGDPGIPFFQNNVLCDYGLDAALGGADMEIGAYIPSLAEWAGMINVGGYALGNTRYNWDAGPDAGQAVVPWFGGVYTRLDMTFANNWDFSIQYNNDSYFDSTGFIRLTYRMGGSRRRNVPDQMEQPMWRNEHIVRAHQTPVVVYNTNNGSVPWRAIHVDNSAAAGGNGTFESPFQTLAEADAVATNPWDIVYVHEGLSTSSSASPSDLYGGTFSFNAPNQFLVGSGGDLIIEGQANCGVNGLVTIGALTTNNPVLSNPAGPSVDLNGQGGVTVANLTITGSAIGIRNNVAGSLDGTAQRFGTTANPFNTTISTAGGSSVRNVIIAGDGSTNLQKGVLLTGGATGGIEFSDTAIGNMNNVGFQIGDGTASSGGAVNVNYYGRIANDITNNGGIASTIIDINNMTGGTVDLAYRGAPSGTTISNEILDVGGEGILIDDNGDPTYATSPTINIGNTTLVNSVSTSIALVNDYSTTTIEAVPNIQANPSYTAGIIKNTDGAAIVVANGAPNFTFFGDIVNSPPAGGSLGYLAQITGVTNDQVAALANTITIFGPGVNPLLDQGDGIFINNTTGNTTINFTGLDLQGTGTTGILVENSAASTVTTIEPTFNFNGTQIGGTTLGPTGEGVLLSLNSVGTSINFQQIDIALGNANARGFVVTNGGTIRTTGANTLSTASTTAATIYIDSNTVATDLNTLNFTSVISGNANLVSAGATETAITIDPTLNPAGLSTGTINIAGAFGIGTDPATATPGVTDNILNGSAAPVDVFVNGVQISP
ncbi:MAG: hypothetical protein ABGW78_06740 [Pirellulales bacterium]